MGIENNIEKLLSKGIAQPYEVKSKANLLYSIRIDGDGKLTPEYEKIRAPKRGEYAFQTDVVISIKGDGSKIHNIPLVVIEIKNNTRKSGITSHEILTYSTKALKHKEIYPYLRYGLLYIHPRENLPQRFFMHNVGFDFAIVVRDPKKEIDAIIKLVNDQLAVSENLRKTIGNTKKATIWRYSVKAEMEFREQDEKNSG